MKTIYNAAHREHQAEYEFFRGEKVAAFEKFERADWVLSAVRAAAIGEVLAPQSFDDAAITRVHSQRYVDFLSGAFAEYRSLGGAGDAFPSVWSVRGMRSDVLPKSFAARMGLFSFDSGTPLTAGSWIAARAGADCALTGADMLRDGERSAFVLTRPPGHHAGSDFFGGYCFLNNAAIAAQRLLDNGCKRVAILDVDYHHGNGTQEIFYSRSDVLFASIHGDPLTEYPFFLGHADEAGEGDGVGFNVNLPLPAGTSVSAWFAALDSAISRIAQYRPDALVVSLGVDTFEGDPISHFSLKTSDYPALGKAIAKLDVPSLFVLEGGYAVAEIGENVVGVLRGFASR
ncbi:MAG: histone deacetylase family protein [Betaproteobacteria bacterium]|nr:MAG: histone deacetylase family protein [Betaproteobacteria bacterium]